MAAALSRAAYTVALPGWAPIVPYRRRGRRNAAIVGLGAVTRTSGVPAGPHAGSVEEAGVLDVAATASEAALAVVHIWLALSVLRARRAPASRTA